MTKTCPHCHATAAAPAVPPNCKHPSHQCFHYGLCTDTDCRNYGTSVLPATPGAERYWEARWRDEKAENERLRAAAVPAVGGEAVAWRWRHVNSPSKDWNYQHQPIGNHNEYLQVEPLFAAQPASPLRGITDEMLNAHLKSTAEWVDPYEAATECGVAIECGITQDEADQLNAQSRASLRVGYAAAFASPPEQPAADPFQPHENCNCLMCIAEKSR